MTILYPDRGRGYIMAMQNEDGFNNILLHTLSTDKQFMSASPYKELTIHVPGTKDSTQGDLMDICDPENDKTLIEPHLGDVTSSNGIKEEVTDQRKSKGKSRSCRSKKNKKPRNKDMQNSFMNEEPNGNLKRKSKYSDIYNSGDISFIRKDPNLRRKKSKLSISEEDIDSSEINLNSEKNTTEVTPDMHLNNSSYMTDAPTEEQSNVIFVHKLMHIMKYPKNKHQQQSALSILRYDKKLMNIFFQEKEKLGKQIIPVFCRRSCKDMPKCSDVATFQQLNLETSPHYKHKQSSTLRKSESSLSLSPSPSSSAAATAAAAAVSSSSSSSSSPSSSSSQFSSAPLSFLDFSFLDFLQEANIFSNDITNSNEELCEKSIKNVVEDVNTTTSHELPADIFSEVTDVFKTDDLSTKPCLNGQMYLPDSAYLEFSDQSRLSPTAVHDYFLGL